MKAIILSIILLIIFEIIIYILVYKFKKNFKWIISKNDEYPKFNYKNLINFYKNSFDSSLGWDRKKNSSGFEKSNRQTKFTISKKGYRGKKNFKKNKISVFGDSFAFCRYVNDDETWEYFLEERLKKNVFNFGVGNYGLDQSFLKFNKYKKKIDSEIIIFNVVPETIARINSYWKHYREFGNIHAFKPIINFNNNKVKILKIKVRKNYKEKKLHNLINFIKKNDIFYKEKFQKNIFSFPYSFQFFKNFKTYSLIFFYLILNEITTNRKFYNKAVKIVLVKNIEESHLMYEKKHFKNKLNNLIKYINNIIKNNKKKMVLLITPQLLDLYGKNLKYSVNYYNKLNNNINCIDLTKDILNIKNFKNLYLQDIYGGHFNKKGNKLVSNLVFRKLKKLKLI